MMTRWPCAAHDFFPPSADAFDEERYNAAMKADHEASMKEDHEKTMRVNREFDCDWPSFTAWCGTRIVDTIENDIDQKIEWLWNIDPDFHSCFGDWLDCREMAAMTGCLDSSLR